MVALSVCSVAWAAEPDREAIRTRLKQVWDAVGTLEVSGEEYYSSPAGVRQSHTLFFEYKSTADGCRVFKHYDAAPDGSQLSLGWFHEDGRKMYRMAPFDGDAASIDNVRITNQVNRHDKQGTMLLSFNWMWTPRGVPLYQYLDERSTLESFRGDDGADLVVVHTESNTLPLRFELDPGHDYLPRVVQLLDRATPPTPSNEWRTTRFQRVEGLWFPVEGIDLQYTNGKEMFRLNMAVRDIHVNRPIPAAAFGMPNLEDGVFVIDDSGGPRYFKGGDAARERLLAKHGVRTSTTSVGVANVAPDQPGWSWWVPGLIVGSLLMTVAAYLIGRSRSSRPSSS